MKKRLGIIIGLLALVIGIVGYMTYSQSIQYGQDTFIKIDQKDANGTPIVAPTQLVRKAGHRNPFKASIKDYLLINENPLHTLIPRKNKTIQLSYKSALTTTKIRHRLEQAKYLQTGIQNVSVPVANGTQYEQLKARQVGRVGTSLDGLTWTILPISYPNTQMQQPIMIYHNKKLTIIDRNQEYRTSNFKDWSHQQLTWVNKNFIKGQVIGVIKASNHRIIVVQGKQRTSGKSGIFYARWLEDNSQIRNWKMINLKLNHRNNKVNLTQSESKIYVTTQNHQRIKIYCANKLAGSFKKVGDFKLKSSKNIQYRSINLVNASTRRFRLYFNKIDKHHQESGTYFQDLTSEYQPIGHFKKVNTDFMWRNFNVTEKF